MIALGKASCLFVAVRDRRFGFRASQARRETLCRNLFQSATTKDNSQTRQLHKCESFIHVAVVRQRGRLKGCAH